MRERQNDWPGTVQSALRGWHNYFKFCSANSWAWTKIDEWVRFRLRANSTNAGREVEVIVADEGMLIFAGPMPTSPSTVSSVL